MWNEKTITLKNLGVFKTLIETKIYENLGGTGKTSFSITASNWNPLNESRGGLNYTAEISDDRITVSDNVDVWFDIESHQTVVTAGIASCGETETGKIILYSEDMPAGNVSGVYYIMKG